MGDLLRKGLRNESVIEANNFAIEIGQYFLVIQALIFLK